jgi:ATP phosphoribosyltransferase regulatory subunit
MTDNDRWLLPEGIEETLPEQTARLEALRSDILSLFASWGYELVMPPFIDYLDSLLTGTGRDLDLQTFKLTDQLTGRTMGVRADMTPQVARIDAHHLRRETPVRLCYIGTVLHARPDGIARSRSPMQVGAELYGYNGIAADVEILRLLLSLLRLARLENLHMDLGHVGIFRGLAREANLTPAQEEELFDALQRKANPEIAQSLSAFGVKSKLTDMILALTELNGDSTVLSQARRDLKHAPRPVQSALDDLESIAAELDKQEAGVPLYFDLAELRGYSYHTGAVYAVFVPGHGQAVAQGGRYDDIGQIFGNARPATGFSTDLRTLLMLGDVEHQPVNGIFAPVADDARLLQTIQELRSKGERVVQALPGQQGGAQAMQCDRELVKEGDNWTIVPAK